MIQLSVNGQVRQFEPGANIEGLLDALELAEPTDVRELMGVDRAVLLLLQDEDEDESILPFECRLYV